MSNHPKRGLAVTHFRPNPEVSYRLRCTHSAQNCVPTFAGATYTWLQIGHPLPLFPLPLPPSPWGLVSKGGGRGPRPLCRFKGVRGEIEIPPRFSLGGPGGTFSFQKRISPLAPCPGNRDCPLWEQRNRAALYAKGPFPLPRHGNAPLWEQREYPLWLPHTESVCFCGESRLIMKYPPDPKILLRFPRYGPSGPGGYLPAEGQTLPPSAPHPPA